MDKTKSLDLEFEQMEKLVKSKKPVKIFLRSGYQMEGVIEDYDSNVIMATVKGQKWMLYRQNLSGIVLN